MNAKMKDEINKYAEEGKFFLVLELLNYSLYTENFKSFNEKLNKIVDYAKNNLEQFDAYDLFGVEEIARQNEKISSTRLFKSFEKSMKEVKNATCKFLFVIKNKEIKLVLTDVLDIFIFLNGLNYLKIIEVYEAYEALKIENEFEFKIKKDALNNIDKYDFDYKNVFKGCLSIETLKETFNTDKANYAYEVYKMLTKHKIKRIEIDDSPLRIIKKSDSLDESLGIIRSYLRGDFKDPLKLFKYFKDIATKTDKSIAKMLNENGFDEIQIESLDKINWKELIEKLNEKKRWKIFESTYLTNFIDICIINQNEEKQISKINKTEDIVNEEKNYLIKEKQIEVILKRYINSILMNFEKKEEIKKCAEKGHFFTVLEILNNSLYNKNFILFNEKLNEMVENGEYNYSQYYKEINSVNEIASKSDFISKNQRYIQYKISIHLKCKYTILFNEIYKYY